MHRLVTVCFSTVRALTLASAWGGHLGVSKWGAQVGGMHTAVAALCTEQSLAV